MAPCAHDFAVVWVTAFQCPGGVGGRRKWSFAAPIGAGWPWLGDGCSCRVRCSELLKQLVTLLHKCFWDKVVVEASGSGMLVLW
mmetsp:Transcript_3914/g.9568  ORF Transcript_3914/g.9568 Transcript_3914/m.9568 type:complete len:84 (-) Transcript_3914:52-303(-)